jgi:hypothetical protein
MSNPIRRTPIAVGVYLFLSVLVGFGWSEIPPEINIQGTLEAAESGPLTGVRDYRVRFISSATGGAVFGEASGTVALSDSGRFSIDLVPTPAVLDTAEVWYELAIDVSGDGIDPNDVFPDRVRIQSVPFALRSGDAQTLGGMPASEYLTPSSVGSSAWSLEGNAGTTPGTHFIGTTDDQPLDLVANGTRALRIVPDSVSPNIIGGYSGNQITAGAFGGTIGGGGLAGSINSITSRYAAIGGGTENTAGGSFSVVGGGDDNTTTGYGSTVSGGSSNSATGTHSSVGGGRHNTAGEDWSVVSGGFGTPPRESPA